MEQSASPSRGWQAANAVAGLIFAYSALVNLNDPDPAGWVMLYGTGAVACVMAGMGRLTWSPAAVMAVGYGLVALLIASRGIGESRPMKGFPQYGMFREEIVRESLGLGLVALWMAVVAVRQRFFAPPPADG